MSMRFLQKKQHQKNELLTLENKAIERFFMFGIKVAAEAFVAGLAAVYATKDDVFPRGTRVERRLKYAKDHQSPSGSKAAKKARRGRFGVAVLR